MQDLFASCRQALDLTATGYPLLSAAVLQGAVEPVNPGNPWAVFRGYPAVVLWKCDGQEAGWEVGRGGRMGIRQCVDDGRVFEDRL